MDNLLQKLNEAVSFIREKTDLQMDTGLVLGSGLGDMAEQIENPVFIPYKDIPFFPISTVPGHVGRLVTGCLEGKNVICMQGRSHFYEGWSMDKIVFPVQVMKMLGVKTLILTNAAGCVNTSWNPGDLMIIEDHIKMAPESPLRGANCDQLGPRFFDMSHAYDKNLIRTTEQEAAKLKINIRKGVYQYFTGPNFETPAEVRFARICGADAVGMSTVPETIAAAHCGLKTLGISCLTNMASGILDKELNHKEVLETGQLVKKDFTALILAVLRKI